MIPDRDPDYVLAAYAASLKVLTSYKTIGEIDLDYELNLAIHEPAKSKVVALIERAKKIAYDFIIPLNFDGYLWKELTPAERFYVKGLESEKNGNYQISTYQEYARGFAISSYGQLMANEPANTCRLKTPQEFAMNVSFSIGLGGAQVSLASAKPFAVFGDIPFTLPAYFDSFEQQSGQEFAEHALIEGKPRLQRIGAQLERIDIEVGLHHSFCSVATEIARLRDLPFEDVERATTENCFRLFPFARTRMCS